METTELISAEEAHNIATAAFTDTVMRHLRLIETRIRTQVDMGLFSATYTGITSQLIFDEVEERLKTLGYVVNAHRDRDNEFIITIEW